MSFNCDICDRSFHTLAARNAHIASSRRHPLCVTCDRRFLNEQARRNHYLSATTRHFFCRTCERAFIDRVALQQHISNAEVHRSGVQTRSNMTRPSTTYHHDIPDLRSVSDDSEDDPSELWASDSDEGAQSEDEALANAIATMTISPAMRQEAMQGYPVWSRSENGSYDSDSDVDEIEGYNSEDFDSSDSESSLPPLLEVGPNDRPLGYSNRGQALETRNNAPSSSSSSSTLNSDGSGALTKSENGASNGKANVTNPNSFIIYTCPLCMEEGGELSSLACGHVFCSTCSKKALHHKRECPMCRQPARMRDVRRIYLAC